MSEWAIENAETSKQTTVPTEVTFRRTLRAGICNNHKAHYGSKRKPLQPPKRQDRPICIGVPSQSSKRNAAIPKQEFLRELAFAQARIFSVTTFIGQSFATFCAAPNIQNV